MWYSVLIGVVLASSDPVATCEAGTAPAAGDFADINSGLVIDAPVNINGPFAETVRQLNRGDQLLVQVRYPVVPPMPTAVAVSAEHGRVTLVTMARTSSEVAILERNPRMGGQLGVGYVQVLLRASEAGKELVTLRIKRADGSIKTVPLAVEIK